ncbi:MAG: LysR family transcriptional regulator [Nocardioides sp.]|uniref:LysR family transcriptional regulator n=1 Tax=Nocardioides sp. TaxID=35761 RepID=UPI0039E42A78
MKQPSFTLVQLRYFAAAAEHGSMTIAARELVVSQSAVSTAIAQLEKGLGVQLLLRHHARGLALTAAGREFYAELRGYLAHTQELADSATNAGQALVGELVIGCFDTLAPFWLPTLVAEYGRRHPGVEVRALEDEHSALKRALRGGECEVALMYGYDLGEDLVPTVVGVAPPHVVLAADHPLAGGATVALADLAEEPMVLLDLPHTNTYFRSLFAELGIEPQVRHRTRGYETVRAMVAAGHGYAVLNQRPAHDLTYAGGRVVALPIREELAPLDIVLARARDGRLTRKAEAFVKMCVGLHRDEEPAKEAAAR